jgi:DNA-binding transcriptional ArsR family regulator
MGSRHDQGERMREQILELLSTTPQKAADIRKAIGGITKSDVNRVLYALQEEGLAKRDEEFQWVLVVQPDPEEEEDPEYEDFLNNHGQGEEVADPESAGGHEVTVPTYLEDEINYHPEEG